MKKKQMHSDRIQQSEHKESQVYFGNVPDKDMLLQSLFPESDENDPRSVHYQRTLARPAIRWGMLILNVLAMVMLVVGIFCLTKYWGAAFWEAAIVTVLFAAGCCMVRLKRITLCLVRLYQRFAPDYIRNKCRFEPSCSEYMILAVSRYGAWQGIRKGVRRLQRCNHHGGGYDWP
ncbi:MAG: membrane protein insertion efficiency factor YidD [Paenibacillaceae bacterium]|nr:membrane protein insertion efficiency factor YidD [Paenibacillaceae bacterium]